jgi:PEP-CTERM motif
MHLKSGLAALLSAALISFASAANASTVEYIVTGTDQNSLAYTADVFLDVTGGVATSGTGTLTGAITGLLGGATQSLTLVTASTPGAENPLGYRSSTGTDLFNVDTVVPVDNNGLLFIIGPPPFGSNLNPLFSFWSDPNAGAVFSGTQFGSTDWASANLPPEPSGVAAVPEPSTWAMMILGFAGVGFLAYRRTRKSSAMVLSAA